MTLLTGARKKMNISGEFKWSMGNAIVGERALLMENLRFGSDGEEVDGEDEMRRWRGCGLGLMRDGLPRSGQVRSSQVNCMWCGDGDDDGNLEAPGRSWR